MKTLLALAVTIVLVASPALFGGEKNGPTHKDAIVSTNLVLTNPGALRLAPEAAESVKGSPLLHPVNPPRTTDGRRVSLGSSNFALIYPVNPPRIVAPATVREWPPIDWGTNQSFFTNSNFRWRHNLPFGTNNIIVDPPPRRLFKPQEP